MALTRSQVKTLHEKLNQALELIASEVGEGVELKLGNGTYSGNNITFKLEVAVPNENGETISKEAQDYLRCCKSYSLKPEWLNQTCNVLGSIGEAKVVGLKPRSRKYPVLVEQVGTGKLYKVHANSVRFAMEKKGL